MGNFEDIGSAESTATLAEAKAIGKQVSFTHRAGAAVTLDAIVIFQGLKKEQRGMRLIDVGVLIVRIPVQTGFAVMTNNERPITEGDQIEYPVSSGRLFFVKSDDDIKVQSNGYDYEVKAIERKTITLGAMS